MAGFCRGRNEGTGEGYVNISNATAGGWLYNTGTIEDSYHMTIATPVIQTPSGTLNIGEGTLVLDSEVSGGTVNIIHGSLEFGGPTSPAFIGTSSAHEFNATIFLDS